MMVEYQSINHSTGWASIAQCLLPRVLLLLAALFATLPARAFAQAGTSGLTGVVTDPSGTAMDRVHIVVLDPATGFSRETDTNNTGNYNVPGLRPGTYSVVATRDGFRTLTRFCSVRKRTSTQTATAASGSCRGSN